MVGRVLRKSFVQPPARAELLLTLDQVSYGFAWASPEKLQGQRLHSLAGWINPSSIALPPPHFYDFFLNVQYKPAKLQLVAIAPFFTFCHYKKEFVSTAFVTALPVTIGYYFFAHISS